MFMRLLKPSESKKKKENHREGGEVRSPHLRFVKAMTSLSFFRQEAEGENRQDSFYKHHKEWETDGIASIYQYRTRMHLVKPSEIRKSKK